MGSRCARLWRNFAASVSLMTDHLLPFNCRRSGEQDVVKIEAMLHG